MPDGPFSSFEEAFRDGVASCRAACACGRVFYNPGERGEWTWEEGELEALEVSGATGLDYAPGYVTFEGVTYVDACSCWHERAKRIATWLVQHDKKIALFLRAEKARKELSAQRSPVV